MITLEYCFGYYAVPVFNVVPESDGILNDLQRYCADIKRECVTVTTPLVTIMIFTGKPRASIGRLDLQ